jgi:hypothetical protein
MVSVEITQAELTSAPLPQQLQLAPLLAEMALETNEESGPS